MPARDAESEHFGGSIAMNSRRDSRTTYGTSRRTIAPFAIPVIAASATLTLGGCANGPQGAFSGAALGAAGGAIIGSIFGEPGAGAAIGAASGALAGGVIGDQNARRDQRALHSPAPAVIERHYYYDAPPPDPYVQRDRYLKRRGG